MEQEYPIRAAVEEDESAVRGLFEEMLRSIYRTDEVEGYEEGYLDRFFAGGEDVVFVAGEPVVGYLSVESHREAQPFAYLDDFCVTEQGRGQGIGGALLRTAEDYARSRGLPAVLLHAEQSNTAALRFYRHRGYAVEREEGSRVLMMKELF